MRDREGKAEVSEVATERARADYYQNLCNLLTEQNNQYRAFLFKSNPSRLSDPSPREWDLGTRCYYLQKDNDALRELCEEYRRALEEAAAKIN